MIVLAVIGVGIGVISGFFGIGGGTVLVPVLVGMGYDIKAAIGISVVQMIFSSVFGSYINSKKGYLPVRTISYLGAGGFSGALLSGAIVDYFNDTVLGFLFIAFLFLALLRMFYYIPEDKSRKEFNKVTLFAIGLGVGVFAISIGVGGSLLIVPILVGFMHYSIKEAVSAGLFFVAFSSIAGFISLSWYGQIMYADGLIIGLASTAGVFVGLYYSHKIEERLQKQLLMMLYFGAMAYMTYELVYL